MGMSDVFFDAVGRAESYLEDGDYTSEERDFVAPILFLMSNVGAYLDTSCGVGPGRQKLHDAIAAIDLSQVVEAVDQCGAELCQHGGRSAKS